MNGHASRVLYAVSGPNPLSVSSYLVILLMPDKTQPRLMRPNPDWPKDQAPNLVLIFAGLVMPACPEKGAYVTALGQTKSIILVRLAKTIHMPYKWIGPGNQFAIPKAQLLNQ